MEHLIAWYDENKYNSLFASIVLLILAPPFLYDLPILSSLIIILVSVVIIICLIILFGKTRKMLWFGFVYGLITLGFVWANFMIKEDFLVLDLISNTLLVVTFGLTFRSVVLEILRLEKVSAQVVIGAIAAYLLLGLMGAFLFDVVDLIYPKSFNTDGLYSGFYSEIYLSFITISTLGYGDITPITPQGQASAIFVSISGQLYLTILMAMLVGKFLKDSDW